MFLEHFKHIPSQYRISLDNLDKLQVQATRYLGMFKNSYHNFVRIANSGKTVNFLQIQESDELNQLDKKSPSVI